MALKMVALTRCSKTGAYIARKGIPIDVRDAHRKLYGSAWERKFYCGSGVPLPEVKRRFAEWQAETAARIEALRSEANGDGRTLTHSEAHALAGQWYSWFVEQHEAEPGDPFGWEMAQQQLADAEQQYLPDDLSDNEVEEFIAADARTRSYVRAFVADAARTSQFLAVKAITLAPEARDRFLEALIPEYAAAIRLLQRRADGDYTHDTRPTRFPKTGLGKPAGMACWQLFEAWVAERQPKPSTVDRRRAVFLHLQEHFGERDIASITDDEAVAWKDSLIGPERSGRTINDVWISAARGVFKWALTNKRIKGNPFQGLRVACATPTQTRDSRAFTTEEATTILRAALDMQPKRLSRHYQAARRWVPWLQAYTGARVQEITQLRAEDVTEQAGVWCLRLTPAAGTIKTNKPRTVPLHLHLIEQGFPDFVSSIGKGPLFYNAHAQAKQRASDPTNPQKALAVKTREHLAKWVRNIGVDHPELSPTHSWRHLFKEIADCCQMSEKASDAITGHAPANIGRKYGGTPLDFLARELAKFPRFKVGGA